MGRSGEDWAGREIDSRYRIVRKLGEGGMGTVYLGQQVSVERPVAIKVLNSNLDDDPQWVQRFLNEARASSMLKHPNTVRLFDFGRTYDHKLYMVMEYLEGVTLKVALHRSPLFPLERSLHVLSQCCASLAEAHSIGIVHRDVKPDNIMLVDLPHQNDHAKVLDFSIAKVFSETRKITATGFIFGTPEYMSPEQARGESLDARADVYSIGAVAYELLTGNPPLTAQNPMDILARVQTEAIRPLPASVPSPIASLVHRCLEKDANKRPASIAEVHDACTNSAKTAHAARRKPGHYGPTLPGTGGREFTVPGQAALADDETHASSNAATQVDARPRTLLAAGVPIQRAKCANERRDAWVPTGGAQLPPESSVPGIHVSPFRETNGHVRKRTRVLPPSGMRRARGGTAPAPQSPGRFLVCCNRRRSLFRDRVFLYCTGAAGGFTLSSDPKATEVNKLPRDPAFALVSAGKTDVGRERSVNEDAMSMSDAEQLYLLCDGMGGHASGQVAAKLAIDTVCEALAQRGHSRSKGKEPLIAALRKANKVVRQRGIRDPACAGMGTTAVALRFEAGRANICHVGDSRVYRLRARVLECLTRDHSLKNLYDDKPELTGTLGPATSNVIVRAIGLEPVVEIEHQRLEAAEGDLYILCSDGLTDLVDDATIKRKLVDGGSLQDMADNLVACANDRGGNDNITVVLVAVATDSANEFGPQGTKLGF